MYDKTTSAQFRKYGFIYDEAKDINKDDLILSKSLLVIKLFLAYTNSQNQHI